MSLLTKAYNNKTPYDIDLPFSSPLSKEPSSVPCWSSGVVPGVSSPWPFTDRMKPTSKKANE